MNEMDASTSQGEDETHNILLRVKKEPDILDLEEFGEFLDTLENLPLEFDEDAVIEENSVDDGDVIVIEDKEDVSPCTGSSSIKEPTSTEKIIYPECDISSVSNNFNNSGSNNRIEVNTVDIKNNCHDEVSNRICDNENKCASSGAFKTLNKVPGPKQNDPRLNRNRNNSTKTIDDIINKTENNLLNPNSNTVTKNNELDKNNIYSKSGNNSRNIVDKFKEKYDKIDSNAHNDSKTCDIMKSMGIKNTVVVLQDLKDIKNIIEPHLGNDKKSSPDKTVTKNIDLNNKHTKSGSNSKNIVNKVKEKCGKIDTNAHNESKTCDIKSIGVKNTVVLHDLKDTNKIMEPHSGNCKKSSSDKTVTKNIDLNNKHTKSGSNSKNIVDKVKEKCGKIDTNAHNKSKACDTKSIGVKNTVVLHDLTDTNKIIEPHSGNYKKSSTKASTTGVHSKKQISDVEKDKKLPLPNESVHVQISGDNKKVDSDLEKDKKDKSTDSKNSSKHKHKHSQKSHNESKLTNEKECVGKSKHKSNKDSEKAEKKDPDKSTMKSNNKDKHIDGNNSDKSHESSQKNHRERKPSEKEHVSESKSKSVKSENSNKNKTCDVQKHSNKHEMLVSKTRTDDKSTKEKDCDGRSKSKSQVEPSSREKNTTKLVNENKGSNKHHENVVEAPAKNKSAKEKDCDYKSTKKIQPESENNKNVEKHKSSSSIHDNKNCGKSSNKPHGHLSKTHSEKKSTNNEKECKMTADSLATESNSLHCKNIENIVKKSDSKGLSSKNIENSVKKSDSKSCKNIENLVEKSDEVLSNKNVGNVVKKSDSKHKSAHEKNSLKGHEHSQLLKNKLLGLKEHDNKQTECNVVSESLNKIEEKNVHQLNENLSSVNTDSKLGIENQTSSIERSADLENSKNEIVSNSSTEDSNKLINMIFNNGSNIVKSISVSKVSEQPEEGEVAESPKISIDEFRRKRFKESEEGECSSDSDNEIIKSKYARYDMEKEINLNAVLWTRRERSAVPKSSSFKNIHMISPVASAINSSKHLLKHSEATAKHPNLVTSNEVSSTNNQSVMTGNPVENVRLRSLLDEVKKQLSLLKQQESDKIERAQLNKDKPVSNCVKSETFDLKKIAVEVKNQLKLLQTNKLDTSNQLQQPSVGTSEIAKIKDSNLESIQYNSISSTSSLINVKDKKLENDCVTSSETKQVVLSEVNSDEEKNNTSSEELTKKINEKLTSLSNTFEKVRLSLEESKSYEDGNKILSKRGKNRKSKLLSAMETGELDITTIEKQIKKCKQRLTYIIRKLKKKKSNLKKADDCKHSKSVVFSEEKQLKFVQELEFWTTKKRDFYAGKISTKNEILHKNVKSFNPDTYNESSKTVVNNDYDISKHESVVRNSTFNDIAAKSDSNKEDDIKSSRHSIENAKRKKPKILTPAIECFYDTPSSASVSKTSADQGKKISFKIKSINDVKKNKLVVDRDLSVVDMLIDNDDEISELFPTLSSIVKEERVMETAKQLSPLPVNSSKKARITSPSADAIKYQNPSPPPLPPNPGPLIPPPPPVICATLPQDPTRIITEIKNKPLILTSHISAGEEESTVNKPTKSNIVEVVVVPKKKTVSSKVCIPTPKKTTRKSPSHESLEKERRKNELKKLMKSRKKLLDLLSGKNRTDYDSDLIETILSEKQQKKRNESKRKRSSRSRSKSPKNVKHSRSRSNEKMPSKERSRSRTRSKSRSRSRSFNYSRKRSPIYRERLNKPVYKRSPSPVCRLKHPSVREKLRKENESAVKSLQETLDKTKNKNLQDTYKHFGSVYPKIDSRLHEPSSIVISGANVPPVPSVVEKSTDMICTTVQKTTTVTNSTIDYRNQTNDYSKVVNTYFDTELADVTEQLPDFSVPPLPTVFVPPLATTQHTGKECQEMSAYNNIQHTSLVMQKLPFPPPLHLPPPVVLPMYQEPKESQILVNLSDRLPMMPMPQMYPLPVHHHNPTLLAQMSQATQSSSIQQYNQSMNNTIQHLSVQSEMFPNLSMPIITPAISLTQRTSPTKQVLRIHNITNNQQCFNNSGKNSELQVSSDSEICTKNPHSNLMSTVDTNTTIPVFSNNTSFNTETSINKETAADVTINNEIFPPSLIATIPLPPESKPSLSTPQLSEMSPSVSAVVSETATDVTVNNEIFPSSPIGIIPLSPESRPSLSSPQLSEMSPSLSADVPETATDVSVNNEIFPSSPIATIPLPPESRPSLSPPPQLSEMSPSISAVVPETATNVTVNNEIFLSSPIGIIPLSPESRPSLSPPQLSEMSPSLSAVVPESANDDNILLSVRIRNTVGDNDDSDDDIPLSVIKKNIVGENDDEDEDVPLSYRIKNTVGDYEDEDDDIPLSFIIKNMVCDNDDEDDDKPLSVLIKKIKMTNK